MPSNWMKQPQQLNVQGGAGRFLNGLGSGDALPGGALSGVPAGLSIGMGSQTCPGDRMIVGEEDILALTLTSNFTLFGGVYQYIKTAPGSTATPTAKRALFWDTTVAALNFQATPDESGTTGVTLFAGVAIMTLTKGNYWWVQTAGRVTGQFRTTLTGTPAAAVGVYLAGAGAGADVGTFDVLTAAGAATLANVDNMLNRYVGPSFTQPANNTASTFSMPFAGRNYRF